MTGHEARPFTDKSIVVPQMPRPPADLFAAAARFGTATLHEAAGRKGALPSAIKPIAQGQRLAGPAFTVHGPGADNLWLHRALAVARPGDVLIACVSGVYEAGYWGDIMSNAALAAGLGGLVIDGCVRDSDTIVTLDFPIFARGFCIRGTGKDFGAQGWLNRPVLIGDVTVHPGDVVVGDGDGVVALGQGDVATVLWRAAEREAAETKVIEKVRAGEKTLSVYGWDRERLAGSVG